MDCTYYIDTLTVIITQGINLLKRMDLMVESDSDIHEIKSKATGHANCHPRYPDSVWTQNWATTGLRLFLYQ